MNDKKNKIHMGYILNNMVELIASMDKNYDFTYFNPSYKTEFKKIFGVDIKIGDNILKKLKHLPKEQENAKQIWSRALDGEIFTIIHKFGDEKNLERNTYEISYSSIKGDDGNVIGASHIVKDVTEREKLKMKAESSLLSKNRFLGSISHELRTPLNAILGFSQLIKLEKNHVSYGDNMDEYTSSILRSGKYLLSLINNILDVNRINDGKLILNIESTGVYNEIKDICKDMKILSNSQDVTLIVDIAIHKNINVMVDRQRYKQIIINLISNGIKYNKNGGNVIVNGFIKDDLFFTIVKDTGIGISKKYINKLGQPFERLGRESTNIEGTGMGLYITKELCKMMNGELTIESILDEGSIFGVGFPISDTNHISHQYESIKTIISKMDFKGHIMYIEDNHFNLFLMEKIIEKNYPKCIYTTERNGKTGFEMIKHTHPSIVMLDVDVPDMNGFEILKEIRNDKTLNDIKFIIISADVSENIYIKSIEAGANNYMSKPIIIPDLIKIINDLIDNIQ